MKTRKPSPAFEAAQELAKVVSGMTEAERSQYVSEVGAVLTIEGHALSIKNTVMAANQLDGVSVVGGFKQWLKAGRCVRKGSTAIWIFAPTTFKDKKGEDQLRFRLVPVFDVSMTDEAMAEAA